MININTLNNSKTLNKYLFTDLNLAFEEKQISGNRRNNDVAPGNDLLLDYDLNAIKNSIKNILFQNRYTSDLKVNLKNHIGENITELRATSIGEEIEKAIKTYETRIILRKIYIYTNIEQNSYNILMVVEFPNFSPSPINLYANFSNNGVFDFINT